ncbi:MAG: hypothetical protein NVS2B11_12440 [Acetobacteraceae bacterium]
MGRFDHVVNGHVRLHHPSPDIAPTVSGLAARTDVSLLFTFAPRTPLLAVMHAAGRLFPRADRAPSIEPVSPGRIRPLLTEAGLGLGRTERVGGGFYISQALEVLPA